MGGGRAQTEYKFVCSEWGSIDTGRVADANVTYDTNANTISVAAGTGANNVALSNGREAPYTTAAYTVSGWQNWFIVVGTNLSTTGADLWWMNGANSTIDPTLVQTLSDGQVLFAWDLSTMAAIDLNLHNDVNYLDGWTGFGLTSTTGTSVISDICFYTLAEAITKYSELEGQLTETTTAYVFNASDWVALGDHTGTTVTPNTNDNTISVTYTSDNEAGLCNGNDSYNTANYYVTADQSWFVIAGTGLSTSGNLLWWMNGYNDAGSYAPTEVTTLTGGSVVLAWDLSQHLGNYMLGKKNTLNGLTCFGLIAENTTTGFTITDINFYTETEAYNLINGTDATHVCTANESHWSTTTTLPSGEHLRVDTWASQSDDIMSTPFMEYYADGDAYLSDATITHEQLTDLTPGMYTVSMDIRIIDYAKDGNDNAKIGAGTKFIANGVSEDLLTGSDGTEDEYGDNKNDEVYGTYTLTCVVDEAGTLDISLDVKDATYSWIMWKNLKVKYLETSSISWEMTDAKWGTLVLPFAADVPSGLTAYSCAGLADDETTLSLTKAETLTANTPYILSGTAGTYTLTGKYEEATSALTAGLLTGTFVDMDYSALAAAAGSNNTIYLLQKHDAKESTDDDEGGVGFYPVVAPTEEEDNSKGATLDAYHCYLDLSTYNLSARPVSLKFPGTGEETGIVAVEGDVIADDAIYDLAGRRVAKAVKGVYIQNGKKVLVK